MIKILLSMVVVLIGSMAALAQEIGGYTNLYYDAGHGVQVEYLTTDGKSFLWYPGNSVILPGRWKTEGRDVCFAYGANTYNPVTGNSGGSWECTPARAFWAGVVERVEGDPLGLASRKRVPFRLRPERTTLAELIGRIGR